MIRGKTAVMFDPTKMLPGASNKGLPGVIAAKKEREERDVADNNATSEQQRSSAEPSSPTSTSEDHNAGNLRHFSRPKVAGRRQPVRIISQDNTQRRQIVALELVQSEKIFSSMLDGFYSRFLRPLQDHPGSFGLEPPQVVTLTSQISEIMLFSRQFAAIPTLGTEPAHAFESHLTEMIRLFTIYITTSIHHIFGLLHTMLDNRKFRQHLKSTQLHYSCNVVDHFLIPTTRLSVYELVLVKYSKTLDGNDQQRLQRVIDQLRDANQEISPHVEAIEASGKILGIQIHLAIMGPNLIYIWNPERRLLRQSTLYKSKIDVTDGKPTDKLDVNRAHGENKRLCLLFSDQLMWTTDLPEMKYKGHVALLDISMEPYDPADNMPCILVRNVDRYETQSTTVDDESTQTNRQKQQRQEQQQQQQQQQQAVAGGRKRQEAWILIFPDASNRDEWIDEVKTAQARLRGLGPDSPLNIPFEVREEQRKGCCTIM